MGDYFEEERDDQDQWDDWEDLGMCEMEYDLLTNFSASFLPIYREAIESFGDPSLFISDIAHDCYGNRLHGDYSLRTREHKDISAFWALLREIKEKEIGK